MRVSQIQNLTWAGNVLVFAGLVWVGFRFFEALRANKVVKELAWEKVKAGPDDSAKRWPGDLKDFEPIWKTPVNGKFPPPPVVETVKPPQIDKWAQFKLKITYLGGWESPGHPELSTARVKFEGKDQSITPGASLGNGSDEWQLLGYTIVDKPDGVRVGKLVFKHPDNGTRMEIEQAPPQGQPLGAPPPPDPFRPEHVGAAQDDVPENGRLGRTAWMDAESGDWYIPDEEKRWIEVWGEKKIWPSLVLKPELDASGASVGLRVGSLPEGTGTPIAKSHGINNGDVIRSINGVSMKSKEDVLLYLRGDGKGLARYVVEVDNNGAVRKIVYRVPRSRQ